MPEFKVEWVIEITADTPEKAAAEALRIQRDPRSSAMVFDVYDGEGEKTEVDLLVEDPDSDHPLLEVHDNYAVYRTHNYEIWKKVCDHLHFKSGGGRLWDDHPDHEMLMLTVNGIPIESLAYWEKLGENMQGVGYIAVSNSDYQDWSEDAVTDESSWVPSPLLAEWGIKLDEKGGDDE